MAMHSPGALIWHLIDCLITGGCTAQHERREQVKAPRQASPEGLGAAAAGASALGAGAAGASSLGGGGGFSFLGAFLGGAPDASSAVKLANAGTDSCISHAFGCMSAIRQ